METSREGIVAKAAEWGILDVGNGTYIPGNMLDVLLESYSVLLAVCEGAVEHLDGENDEPGSFCTQEGKFIQAIRTATDKMSDIVNAIYYCEGKAEETKNQKEG